MVVNPDSVYNGAYFTAKIDFPKEYPYRPPGNYTSHDECLTPETNLFSV